MTIDIDTLSGSPETMQHQLKHEVAAIFDEPLDLLEGWTINRIRPDGAVDAYVPLDQLSVMDVPTDPVNIDWLVGLFNKRAAEVGGTGQRDPVVVGHVYDDAFYMLDGFHRHTVQEIRGESHLHATVEPNLTYEQVVKRQIEYTQGHPEIEFARQVEMIQSLWDKTPWKGLMPNVLTAFRAFQDDYALVSEQGEIGLIDSLSDEVYQQVRVWVASTCKDWGLTPKEIREKLLQIEGFDPRLATRIYTKKGKTPEGKISLGQVEVIRDIYPGEVDLQDAIVDVVISRGLSVEQTKKLVEIVEADEPVYPEDIRTTVEGIDFGNLKSSVKSSKMQGNRTLGSVRYSRMSTGLELESTLEEGTIDVLRAIHQALPMLRQEALQGTWGKKEMQQVLEVGIVASEILSSLTATDSGVSESND